MRIMRNVERISFIHIYIYTYIYIHMYTIKKFVLNLTHFTYLNDLFIFGLI